MKTLVVVVDGMRPDALVKTENAKYLLEKENDFGKEANYTVPVTCTRTIISSIITAIFTD